MNTMYNIQDVVQIELSNIYEIQFTIDDFLFSVIVYKPRPNSYQTNRVAGVFHENKEPCPLCKELGVQSRCSVLYQHLDVLFEQLISTPALRLLWIFFDYEVF